MIAFVRRLRDKRQKRNIARRIRASNLFDPVFYVEKYPDVLLYKRSPLDHFIDYGGVELRSPSSKFDSALYVQDNPEVRNDNPLLDWLDAVKTGETRVPPKPHTQSASDSVSLHKKKREIQFAKLISENDIFDQSYYQNTYPDIDASMDVLSHYATYGQYESRSPSPEFDAFFYEKTHLPRRQNSARRALDHFIHEGRSRSLATRPPFSVTLDRFQAPARVSAPNIAIQIHLYYPEMVELFIAYLANIKFAYDLYISSCTSQDRNFIERFLSKSNLTCASYEVRLVPNHGRDIAPLLVAFRDIWSKYDYICHLHSKRSPHTPFGSRWLDWNLRHMFGTSELVEAAIDYLEHEPNCGMLFCDNFTDIKPFIHWGGNKERAQAFIARLNSEFVLPEVPQFAAGSMAWFRTAAFRKLMDQHLGYEDFEQEKSQVEGTLAHILERVFPYIANASGFFTSTFYLQNAPSALNVRPLFGAGDERDLVGTRWKRDTPSIARNQEVALAPLASSFNPEQLDIHWIIPDFAPGLGGHMTIFRHVQHLEKFGHRQTIWIQNPVFDRTPRQALLEINTHFRRLGDKVTVRYLPDDVRQLCGDVLIATDCWTAFPARSAPLFKERFYLIQDYEPMFHPMGSNYLIAEMTYSFGFAALCAGDWLLEKARAYGMWVRKWDLCSDTDVYFPGPSGREIEPGRRKRQIVFYSRSSTPRRAVDLGVAAFEELSRRRSDFVISCFGEEAENDRWTFPSDQLGILSPTQIAELYRSADVGVAFSTTNYSLVPLEMMSCKLPIVEINSQSARAAFPPGTVAFGGPDPMSIADAIERLLDDQATRDQQIAEASAFVGTLDWEKSARKINQAIVARLNELGFEAQSPVPSPALVSAATKVSVIIPTYNGGQRFRDVLGAVCRQKCEFKFDVLVIDSSSTDETAQIAYEGGDRVRVHVIPKEDFQHGRTRNLGVSMTDGEFVAVLTQDATPKNESWLSLLIGAFDLDPLSAGVFGRHIAYPEHNRLLARDIDVMFDRFKLLGPVFKLSSGLPSFYRPGGIDWRMTMAFYSDNNSALRRAAWDRIPYPEIDWGEDQVWAQEAMRLGYSKIYADGAAVYHSHEFQPSQQMAVGYQEGIMFSKYFGLQLHAGVLSSDEAGSIHRNETVYATENGLPLTDVDSYVEMLKYSIEGRVRGGAH